MNLENKISHTFRHFKGTDYRVLGLCELNGEPHVLYVKESMFSNAPLEIARHSESLKYYKVSIDLVKRAYYNVNPQNLLTGDIEENPLIADFEKTVWMRPVTSFLQVLENGIPRFKHLEY